MSENPTFKKAMFLQGLAAAVLASAGVYFALWQTNVLSPLGTVVVPLLTLVGTSILAYLRARM
jgi:hypothetical protein